MEQFRIDRRREDMNGGSAQGYLQKKIHLSYSKSIISCSKCDYFYNTHKPVRKYTKDKKLSHAVCVCRLNFLISSLGLLTDPRLSANNDLSLGQHITDTNESFRAIFANQIKTNNFPSAGISKLVVKLCKCFQL